MKHLIALQKQVYEANKAKGFWDDAGNRNRDEAVALIISELSEALEAHRKGRSTNYTSHAFNMISGNILTFAPISDVEWMSCFGKAVKDTWQDELADTVIRILDYTGGFDITLRDVTKLVELEGPPPENFREATLGIVGGICAAHFDSGDDDAAWSILLYGIITWCDSLKIDLSKHVEMKLRYNSMRPHKHGKSY